jgi:hypothetical protein
VGNAGLLAARIQGIADLVVRDHVLLYERRLRMRDG